MPETGYSALNKEGVPLPMTIIEEIRQAEMRADEIRRQARLNAREVVKAAGEEAAALSRDGLRQLEQESRQAIQAAERDAASQPAAPAGAGDWDARRAQQRLPEVSQWLFERIVNDVHR